jgi:hypothetical protein
MDSVPPRERRIRFYAALWGENLAAVIQPLHPLSQEEFERANNLIRERTQYQLGAAQLEVRLVMSASGIMPRTFHDTTEDEAATWSRNNPTEKPMMAADTIGKVLLEASRYMSHMYRVMERVDTSKLPRFRQNIARVMNAMSTSVSKRLHSYTLTSYYTTAATKPGELARIEAENGLTEVLPAKRATTIFDQWRNDYMVVQFSPDLSMERWRLINGDGFIDNADLFNHLLQWALDFTARASNTLFGTGDSNFRAVSQARDVLGVIGCVQEVPA